MDAFVLLLGIVSPHSPLFSKIVQSPIVGSMDSDTHRPGWNGRLVAVCTWKDHCTLNFEMGVGGGVESAAILPVYYVFNNLLFIFNIFNL